MSSQRVLRSNSPTHSAFSLFDGTVITWSSTTNQQKQDTSRSAFATTKNRTSLRVSWPKDDQLNDVRYLPKKHRKYLIPLTQTKQEHRSAKKEQQQELREAKTYFKAWRLTINGGSKSKTKIQSKPMEVVEESNIEAVEVSEAIEVAEVIEVADTTAAAAVEEQYTSPPKNDTKISFDEEVVVTNDYVEEQALDEEGEKEEEDNDDENNQDGDDALFSDDSTSDMEIDSPSSKQFMNNSSTSISTEKDNVYDGDSEEETVEEVEKESHDNDVEITKVTEFNEIEEEEEEDGGDDGDNEDKNEEQNKELDVALDKNITDNKQQRLSMDWDISPIDSDESGQEEDNDTNIIDQNNTKGTTKTFQEPLSEVSNTSNTSNTSNNTTSIIELVPKKRKSTSPQQKKINVIPTKFEIPIKKTKVTTATTKTVHIKKQAPPGVRGCSLQALTRIQTYRR